MDALPFIVLVSGVITLVLGAITLLGHGIWVVLAAMFGGGRKPRRKCVYCGRLTPPSGSHCEWCGKDLTTPLSAELADIEAVFRQLRRLSAKGTLKSETAEHLATRLRAYQQQLFASRAMPVHEPAGEREEAADAIVLEPVAEPEAELRAASPPPMRPATSATRPIPPVIMPVKPSAPPAPRPPRRSWSEVLAAFMEERNIRWGELVGGLLFVCSSVALVISFWDRLQENPYYKLAIFVMVSSAVFGVGLYAHHRWKLRSTSQGMLIIAMLLVPVNFLAMAELLKNEGLLLALFTEGACLALFGWLSWMAARVLAPAAQWAMAAATMGSSAALLTIGWLVGPQSPGWMLTALGALPVALFAVGIAWHLRSTGFQPMPEAARSSAEPTWLNDAVVGLFTHLGIIAFAVTVTLGLLVARAVHPFEMGAALRHVLQQLSVVVALSALPGMAVGLAVMRATRRDKSLGAYYVAGTTLAMIGMVIMLAAMGLAWPLCGWLIAVGLFNATALAVAAFRWRFPILHAGTIACTAVAYLVAFHWLAGDLAPIEGVSADIVLLKQLISAPSGMALAGLFLVLAAISEAFARFGHRRHGAVYMGGAAAVAEVGLLLVTSWGFWNGNADATRLDALRAAILYALYGVGSLGLVLRWRRVELSYLGLTLLSAAPLWLLWWHPQTHHVGPTWASVLAAESLLMTVLAVLLSQRSGGVWDDIWARLALLLEEDPGAAIKRLKNNPRSLRSTPLADFYRVPLAHLGEAIAAIAVVAGMATAWANRSSIHGSPAPVVTAGCLAAVWWVLAWPYRSGSRTWLGSLIALIGLVHAFVFNYTDLVVRPWLVSLLLHSTAVLLAAILLEVTVRSAGVPPATSDDEDKTYSGRDARAPGLRDSNTGPLADSALLSSALFVPAAIFGPWGGTTSLACCLFWLAGIWLVLAWRNRWAGLVAAHQAALMAAVLAACTAWMERAGWIAVFTQDVLYPRNLHVYGIALGLLSLAWIAVRIIARRAGGQAARLFDRWLSVDWLVRHGVIAAQAVLLASCLLPEVPRELSQVHRGLPEITAPHIQASGGTAWAVLAVLVAVQIAALWERWRKAELVSAILLTSTLAGLVAGQFTEQLAVASALRWTLAAAFLVGAAAICARERLLAWCRSARTAVELGPDSPRLARGVLLAAIALPMLGLTMLAATWQVYGAPLGGPVEGTLFSRISPTWSYLMPLAAVMAGMIAFALRERSEGYAFSAGLVLEMCVTLGYTLHTDASGGAFDAAFQVTLLQLATIAAAVWALMWLRTQERLYASDRPTLAQSPWLMVQIGLSVMGNLLLLVPPVLQLAYMPGWPWEWFADLAAPAGWAALLLTATAVAWYLRRIQSASPLHALGGLLLGAGVLAACWVVPFDQGLARNWLAYHVLLASWASACLLLLVADFGVRRGHHARMVVAAFYPSQSGDKSPHAKFQPWLILIGGLVVSLALIHFPEDPGRPWWSACAVLAISLAAGLAALELRRAENVYASGLLLNVAGMLLWWTWQPTDTKWLPSLLETNILCLSLSAVIWSLTERLCPGAVPHPAMEPPVNWREDAPPRLPFPHTAVMACTGLAVALALLGLFNGLNARPHLAALGALAVAILLPVDATPDQRGARQHAVILLAVLLLNAAGWALLPADIAAGPLHRSVVLMIASAAVTVLAFVGQALPDSRKAGDATSGDLILVRHSLTYGNDWLARARQALPGLAGLTAVMIAAVLIQEAFRFHTGLDVPLAPWEIAAVAGSMLTIAAACIAFAVVAEWDPFRQNDRQRQIYVYLAEAVLLLIGFHVRFTMPWIFRGYFQQYWMFLVMAVSFLGAGLSEWFYRRRLPVLAQPLERTCLLVPLIPAVGYWFMPEAEYLWWLVGQTPLLWFFMGLFYSVISATRRSVLSAVLAVLAMNMGLWVTLHAHDIRFLYHPQLWLIPLALAALVAGHLGRDRLTEAQRAAIHYSTLSVIYISSTFDMYIDWTLHLGWHWQLPLVLMVLSVAGTMAGILLRVRSFLYLGVTFLIVDLLSMICHAAIDYPWIWYASGVVLGAAIIAVFALFEKRRNDVLAAVEKLREWKG